LLATVGAGLVSSGGNLAGLASGQLMKWGNFLVLLSAWVWAVFTIINRRLAGKRPAVMMTAGMMFFGGMFTLPWFVVQRGWEEFATLNTTTWGALLYIGILSTAGSYLLYTHALTLTEASKIAAIQNIEPLIAMLAAAFIVAEPITGTLVLGGAAIVVGVTLAERAGPERAQDYRLPD
jgi:drug/metabolite transporter (DMT)-like permease